MAAHEDACGQPRRDEGKFGPERRHEALDWQKCLLPQRLAGAESAEPLAEWHMQINRHRLDAAERRQTSWKGAPMSRLKIGAVG